MLSCSLASCNPNEPSLPGFVGLFNLLLLWPGFLVLHYTGFESFELPSQLVWTYILINGLIGTVLSEFLWLWYEQGSHGHMQTQIGVVLLCLFSAMVLASK